MKYLRLVLRNAVRNLRRALLTVLSIAIAVVAICVLNTIIHAFNAGVEFSDESRLVVRHSVSLVHLLPIAYRERIASVPGVKSVCAANWFGGVYQDRKQFFGKFAVEAEAYFAMYPELRVPEEAFRTFCADRRGCVVGRKLAAKYGFKVDDTIPIIGDIYAGNWEFKVHGIYDGLKPSADETVLFFHWRYLDEGQPRRLQGRAGFYIVWLADPRQAERVAKAVDAEFENSPDQTLTETEKAFNLGFVRMMGNIELLVQFIGSAVVFALLLVAGNTMAMAARERTTEVAILKAIGFKSRLLASLVVAEAVLLTLGGWLLGAAWAWLACEGVEKTFPTMFPVFSLKPQTVALALAVAAVTGAVSGLFPACLAARTTVVDAMRKVA